MVVSSEGGEQQRLAGEARELHGRDRAPTGGLLEWVARVHDLAGARHVRNARELHPLDVPHHSDARSISVHARQPRT